MKRILALAAAVLLAGGTARGQVDPATAERFAKLALGCLEREYPNRPARVLEGASDVKTPREVHPSFYGCYDWHSSVQNHWMLARLLRAAPAMPSAGEIRSRLDAHLSPESIGAEARSLEAPAARTFERPYGWAWTLRLAAELRASDDPRARAWRDGLQPLEAAAAARLQEFLPKLTLPVRGGGEANTAFALAQALDYARAARRNDLEKILMARASFYYGQDRACPLAWEPSGEDLFSPCLAEADLMRRMLGPKDFAKWLHRFLPQSAGRRAFPLAPATSTDPADPRLVHLDGLNLSRAWMLRGIAQGLPPSDPRRAALLKAASAHEVAGLARVTSGDYAGEHWLPTFAVFLLAP